MYSVEGSKLIQDLGTELIEHVRTSLFRKIKAGGKPFSTYLGADVYKFGDFGSGYVVLARGSDVLYFVRYEKIRHNALPLGRQVLVWRNKDDPATVKFARTVFFNYLLPKFTALVSDTLQTTNGKAFWQYSIDKALAEDKYVYFLDRRSSPNRLIRLIDYPELVKYSSEIWGTDEGHKRTFAVISLKPLQLKSKQEE